MTAAHFPSAGWSLTFEDEDLGEEGRPRTWWLVDPEGHRHLLDVSSYRRDVPAEIVRMMIDMGIPQREAFGVNYPLTDELIEARWRFWAELTGRMAA